MRRPGRSAVVRCRSPNSGALECINSPRFESGIIICPFDLVDCGLLAVSADPFSAVMAVVVHFNDDDMAAGVARVDLTLLGLVIGTSPPLHTLRTVLTRVWRFEGDLTISQLDGGLLQFVFSLQSDLQAAVSAGPWIFDKYMLTLQPWATPSEEVIGNLRWAPLAVQIWGVPFDCFTNKMALRLGSALGETATPTLHRSDVSGGLYVRAEPVLNLLEPLPDSISAGHIDPQKGTFSAKIKFELVSHFCFLCGVIGHVKDVCPRKEELGASPAKYGKFTMASESGPQVTEAMLARRRRRYTWIRANFCNQGKPRRGGGTWEDSRRPGTGIMGSRFQSLSLLHPSTDSHAQQVRDVHSTDGTSKLPLVDSSPVSPQPAAKRLRFGSASDTSSAPVFDKVAGASLNWPPADP
ncbi:unnamed protein product [Linum trigynum]|uniref:DUF4283 domain-containing protein n=1 Tax=Linum trigynum TaxID=586398 RepID=A0AAV2FWM4_9ROSI